MGSWRIKAIKENLDKKKNEICKIAGVSEKMLNAICYHNNIDLDSGWSEEEKQVLREMYYDAPYSEIKKELLKHNQYHRTNKAIRNMASKMGLERSQKRGKSKSNV